MRAARWHGRGDVRVEEVPDPELVPGSVAIDVAWCGVCGTDLHEYTEGPIFIPAPGHPHPVSGESAPLVIGHEFSGTVTALGEGVGDLRVGESVVVEPYILAPGTPTGDDDAYQLSPGMNFIGLAGRGGGLAERIVVEVADRCKGPVSALGATYTVLLPPGDLADADPSRIAWRLEDGLLTFLSGRGTSASLAEAGRGATRVQALADSAEDLVRTRTLVCNYTWSVRCPDAAGP